MCARPRFGPARFKLEIIFHLGERGAVFLLHGFDFLALAVEKVVALVLKLRDVFQDGIQLLTSLNDRAFG